MGPSRLQPVLNNTDFQTYDEIISSSQGCIFRHWGGTGIDAGLSLIEFISGINIVVVILIQCGFDPFSDQLAETLTAGVKTYILQSWALTCAPNVATTFGDRVSCFHRSLTE